MPRTATSLLPLEEGTTLAISTIRRMLARQRHKRGGGTRHRPPGAAPTRRSRLLIVDDDESALRLLHHTLEALGDIHYAKCGNEAMHLARRLSPDLILLDARMPGCDGLDVCKALKAELAFQHVPIVLVTRYADPATERRAFEAGAADFIAKPYAPAVVQARVRNLLGIKQRSDAELRAAQDHWRRIGDARVADIVNAATDAIVSHDAQGLVVLANPAAGRMFGMPHDLLIGRPIRSLLGADLPAIVGAPEAARRVTLRLEHEPAIRVEAAVSSAGDGPHRLVTVMLRGTSTRDKLAQLEQARIELEAAARARSQMLSGVAHEMGAPLNGVIVFAQLMAMDQAHPLPPEQARRLELILASGQSLQSLLRDVLELGQVESGVLKTEVTAVDAALCVASTIEVLAPTAAVAGVELSYTAPAPPALYVMADASRLRQCLANLLGNAIKYNRQGGRVEVALKAQGEQIAIAVRDNGLGMSAQQLTQLYEPFNRLGRQSSATPGTGLGLWITRQLVRAMGGQLLVESEADQGSCFTLVLPRGPQAAPVQGGLVRTDSH